MMVTRTGARRLFWPLGVLACLATLAAGAALFPNPGLAQSQSLAQLGAQLGAQPAAPGPAAGQLSPAGASLVEGFRQARFGMGEAEVRQAIQRDFPAAAGRLARATHPRERTTVLSLTADELLPGAGPAQIFYVLGYASKRLVQINIIWSSDGRSAARDEGIIAAANALRDHLRAQYPAPPDKVVTNQKVGENAFVVFRAAQEDDRMVLLVLSGVPAAGRASQVSAAPLTLQLSYIRNYRNPDIFHIERGNF